MSDIDLPYDSLEELVVGDTLGVRPTGLELAGYVTIMRAHDIAEGIKDARLSIKAVLIS